MGIVVQGLWYAVTVPHIPRNIPLLGACGITGVILYGVTVYYVDRNRIQGFIQSLHKLS